MNNNLTPITVIKALIPRFCSRKVEKIDYTLPEPIEPRIIEAGTLRIDRNDNHLRYLTTDDLYYLKKFLGAE